MELKELREKTLEKLQEHITALRTELQKLRFENASGRLKRVREIRRVRQEIARVKTVLLERTSK